ncbi:GNAT family protein [uncultured Shewanella sp.]|uniref:GNAT family N-acetyltransferase n=1 Tax=uncultured Shewanella sp. TaxID=173975 RepID=UPI002617BC77|nr:GNAT family protein [uncultured Shewanella sp.]
MDINHDCQHLNQAVLEGDNQDSTNSATPMLETIRLRLDETTLDDSEEIFALFSNPKVTQFYDLGAFESIHKVREFINEEIRKQQNKQMLRWAIRDKMTLDYLGGCGVNHFESERHVAVIGYELCQEAWGKGIATEALEKVAEFLFSVACIHSVNRIEAYVMQGNTGSEMVLRKLGFIKEGVLRQHSYWKGRYHDLSLYTLLRDDWVNGNN